MPIRRLYIKILGGLIGFFFSSPESLGQYSISGQVINYDKQAIENSQVTLSGPDSLIAAALTDRNGRFIIKNLSAGEYILQIFSPGYTAIEQSCLVHKNLRMEFVLMQEMTGMLDEIVVKADQSDRVKRTATGQIFYLSEQARNSGDPFRALKEIPKLFSNEALQSLSMEDGSIPLILINGNMMNSGIAPIDPKEIESVEVIDVVNARYLRKGIKHIVNIKLKKTTAPYLFFQTATRHDLPLREGLGVVYFEIGNPNYSLYSRAGAQYLYNDDTRKKEWQKNEGYFKQSSGTNRDNKNTLLGELLLKWKMTGKDFLAAHLYATTYDMKTKSWGKGKFQEKETETFDFTAFTKNKAYIWTASLYHKHIFSENETLETTLAYNKNENTDKGEQNEIYTLSNPYYDLYEYKNQRSSGSLNIDYSKEWNEVHSLNIGNETRIVNDFIDKISENTPAFKHQEWTEYLYASFGSKTGHLMYMLSAGLEFIWLKAGNEKNHYFKPRIAVGGTYEFNRNNSIHLSYTWTNQAPAVGQLNPYNTSTDPLVVNKGNPELRPVQHHTIETSYTFNKSGFYFTPSLSYHIFTDRIEPFGTSENGIYINSYRNAGKFRSVKAGGSVSYRLKKWGRIYANAYHHTDYFQEGGSKQSFSCGGGLFLNYNKWSFLTNIEFRNYEYTAISRTKQRTPEFSQVQLIYNFTPDFYISVAIPYVIGPLRKDTDVQSGSYTSYTSLKMVDRSVYPWILLRYTFRKNNKRKIKLDNIINSKESGISL